jgi:hypothetical protein
MPAVQSAESRHAACRVLSPASVGGSNFILYARAVHRALKRQARRAVSLAFADARAA